MQECHPSCCPQPVPPPAGILGPEAILFQSGANSSTLSKNSRSRNTSDAGNRSEPRPSPVPARATLRLTVARPDPEWCRYGTLGFPRLLNRSDPEPVGESGRLHTIGKGRLILGEPPKVALSRRPPAAA